MTAEASAWLKSQRIYLARELARTIEAHRLTRAEARELLAMHPSDISRLLNGRYLERYSVDRLIDCLMRLGCIATITIGEGGDIVGAQRRAADKVKLLKHLESGEKTTNSLAVALGMKHDYVYRLSRELRDRGDLKMIGARWGLDHRAKE